MTQFLPRNETNVDPKETFVSVGDHLPAVSAAALRARDNSSEWESIVVFTVDDKERQPETADSNYVG